MTNNFRVFNVTRGYSLKRKQALKAIDNCAAAWVEPDISIRDLTLAEAIQARKEQARRREPLPFAEIRGLKFDPPASGTAASRMAGRLTWEAHEFARTAA